MPGAPWFLSAAVRTLRALHRSLRPASSMTRAAAQRLRLPPPAHDKEGFFLGTLAMNVDLEQMSYPLRQPHGPLKGEFYLVDRAGDILLHSGCGNLFRHRVDRRLIEQMTNGADHLFDASARPTSTTTTSPTRTGSSSHAVSDARFKEVSSSESHQLQITLVGCMLICLLCWWSLRHVLQQDDFRDHRP